MINDKELLIIEGGANNHLSIINNHLKNADGISKQKKEQAAKDFESVLLGKLLDEMKNSIGDWGFEEDGTSKQIEGIFWLYLARHLADNGGLGLWKDIYQTLTNPDQTNKTTKSLDKTV
jgi:Rod binding domain-containing protein